MKSSRLRRALVATGMTALLFTASGCASATSPFPTPTPSEAPERPAASAPDSTPSATPEPVPEELVLTTDGIGSLRLGEDPAASELVEFDPDRCLETNGGVPAEGLGRWVWLRDGPEPYEELTLEAVDGPVGTIEVRQRSIATDRGIAVGSTLEELREAYPELESGAADDVSSLHLVRDGERMLVFEVASDTWYEPAEQGRVLYIVAALNPPEQLLDGGRAQTDWVIGGCL